MSANLWTYNTQPSLFGSSRPGVSAPAGASVGLLWQELLQFGNGDLRLRAIVGSADTENWAGASIYVSPDGTSYAKLGATRVRSIVGKLTAGCAAGDTTLYVDVSASPGQLVGCTAAEAGAGQNNLIIGSEVVSFTGVTLTATNQYTLTGVTRGLYGTSGATHVLDDPCYLVGARQDSFRLPMSAVGQTWHYKLVSFNVAGVEVDISGVSDNTVAISATPLLQVTGTSKINQDVSTGGTPQFAGVRTVSSGVIAASSDTGTAVDATGGFLIQAVGGDTTGHPYIALDRRLPTNGTKAVAMIGAEFNGLYASDTQSSDLVLYARNAGTWNVGLRVKATGFLQVGQSGTTGAGSAALGANCPAGTPTAPYTWLEVIASDGTTVYIPAWA